MRSGYIKLHRSIIEWEWYGDANTCRVFLHLLCTANYEVSKYMGRTIERGQAVFGRKKMAEELHLTEDQIRTAVEHLKSTSEITIETTNKFSIATIANYSKYQGIDDENPQQIPQQEPRTIPNESPTNPQQIPTSKNIRSKEDQEPKKRSDSSSLRSEESGAAVAKKPYGKDFGNVMLTDTEYQKLTAMGEALRDYYIDRADGYFQQIGVAVANKRYKSHYATILNWKRKDETEGKRPPSVQPASATKYTDGWGVKK